MKYYNTPKVFFNNQHPVTVIVVGAGGTGSYLMSKLAKINLALLGVDYKGLDVCLVDNDLVEESNVYRQNFLESDIGRYKSECVISKINMAYNFNWSFSTKKVISNSNFIRSNIIISCIDNVEGRKHIQSIFNKKRGEKSQHEEYQTYFWIDCGNGKDFGQVVLHDEKERFPSIFDYFPNLSEDETNTKIQGGGCSVWDVFQEQDLFINDTLASIAGQMIWEMFRDYRIDYNAVFVNMKDKTQNKSLISNIKAKK